VLLKVFLKVDYSHTHSHTRFRIVEHCGAWYAFDRFLIFSIYDMLYP